MTINQYSTINRCIGKLEGLALALPSEACGAFFDAIEVLDTTIEEIISEETIEPFKKGEF